MKEVNWSEYERLRDLVLENRADKVQLARFEQLVLNSAAMKRDYAEHAQLVAALCWEVGHTAQAAPVAKVPVRSSHRWIQTLAALAAGISLAFVGAWYFLGKQQPAGLAIIAAAENCQWGDSTLPTTINQELSAGRLRLLSGIATVRFPNVNVTLEGPVDFELVQRNQCRVHQGRVFASVEPGGEGFTIDTPNAKLTDRGTVFGVNVLPSGGSNLRVFQGEVDVDHGSTGDRVTVKKNDHVRISSAGIGTLADTSESAFADPNTLSPIESGNLRSVQISTAIGAGDDAYITPQPHPPENVSHTALLVKRPPSSRPGEWGYPWRRKAFLRFDMSLLRNGRVETAALQLHGVQTNIGFASLMPDATFAVYGLLDESEDDWDSQSITWRSCPAQWQSKLDPDAEKVELLGKFVVPTSNPTGRFEMSGSRLVDFLRNDTNGLATLIVIPETVGRGEAYVHGFASKRHAELPAPTLRLKVAL